MFRDADLVATMDKINNFNVNTGCFLVSLTFLWLQYANKVISNVHAVIDPGWGSL